MLVNVTLWTMVGYLVLEEAVTVYAPSLTSAVKISATIIHAALVALLLAAIFV